MATHGTLAPYRARRDFARAMPFAWREATAAPDPRPSTVGTAPPVRLKRADPWAGCAAAAPPLPGPR
jgi:bifunctional non-homologous end joining protein LigD